MDKCKVDFRANGCPFSTRDRNNGEAGSNHCANLYKGGWWFTDCSWSNLNGIYYEYTNNTLQAWFPNDLIDAGIRLSEMMITKN